MILMAKSLSIVSFFIFLILGKLLFLAIFAMGLVGSGTNNARLAQMLRQLAVYYQKDANALFMVRQAQGLVHLGKGTLTMNPFHSDKSLMNVAAASALLSTIVTCLDSRALILGKHHFLLYSIVPSIQVNILDPSGIEIFVGNSDSEKLELFGP